MTDQAADRSDLLQRRLALVAALSALNAEALKLTQSHAGIEMEVLRCELEIARNGEDGELVRNLHDANESAKAIEAARVGCEQRIAAAEDEVRNVDVALASAVGT